jgi:hypothetical protein
MKEKKTNWKQEAMANLIVVCATLLPAFIWGLPGFLAGVAALLLMGVVAWLCLDKNNRFIALILLFIGIS